MKALSLGHNVGVSREGFLEQEPRSSPSHFAEAGSKQLVQSDSQKGVESVCCWEQHPRRQLNPPSVIVLG